MTNCKLDTKGNILTITVDLSKDNGESKSGKTTIIGTTGGNQPVSGHDQVYVGLNVYRKK